MNASDIFDGKDAEQVCNKRRAKEISKWMAMIEDRLLAVEKLVERKARKKTNESS